MRKAIYVEPDHELATNVILNLKTIDIFVIHFCPGTEALFEFERNAPDFFLLDLHVPRKSEWTRYCPHHQIEIAGANFIFNLYCE